MKKRICAVLKLFLFFLPFSCAQQVPELRPTIKEERFDNRLTSLLNFSVPLMGVEELHKKQTEVYIFDAREQEEYAVSHIPGARYLGYRKFDADKLADIPKDAEIVLYCSVGYRSEKIGEKLRDLGYENIYNLYGSIFEWVNQGYTVVDKNNQPVQEVHTYNKAWSKWMTAGNIKKTW